MTSLAIKNTSNTLPVAAINDTPKLSKKEQIIRIVALAALALLAVAIVGIVTYVLSGITAAIIASAATATLAALGAIVYKVIQSKKPALPPTINTPAIQQQAPQVSQDPPNYLAMIKEQALETVKSIGYTIHPDGTWTIQEGFYYPPLDKEIQTVSKDIESRMNDMQFLDVRSIAHLPTKAQKPYFEEYRILCKLLVASFRALIYSKIVAAQETAAAKGTIHFIPTYVQKSVLDYHLKETTALIQEDLKRAALASNHTFLFRIGGECLFLPLIQIWAKCGADFGATSKSLGNTPLIHAIAQAENSLAMEFLNQVDQSQPSPEWVSTRSKVGTTALHLAVGKGYKTISAGKQKLTVPNVDLARKLVAVGANRHVQDKNGNTPLHLAALRRDSDMIQALLNTNPDPGLLRIKNNSGQTPVDMLDLTYSQAQGILQKTVAVYLLDQAEFNDPSNLAKVKGCF